MPYKEPEIQKLYYSIGELSKRFGISASLIRYWENEFDLLKPKKNKKGNRLFTQTDVDHLQLIYHLIRERGYTLEGAKRKLKENKEATLSQFKMRQRLMRIRAFLVNLREQTKKNNDSEKRMTESEIPSETHRSEEV